MTDKHQKIPTGPRKTPGPKPDQLKLKGDWQDAAKKALKKERPPEGWPNPEEMQETEKGPASDYEADPDPE